MSENDNDKDNEALPVRPRWANEPPPFVSGGKLNEVTEEQALCETQELDDEMEEYRQQGEAEREADADAADDGEQESGDENRGAA